MWKINEFNLTQFYLTYWLRIVWINEAPTKNLLSRGSSAGFYVTGTSNHRKKQPVPCPRPSQVITTDTDTFSLSFGLSLLQDSKIEVMQPVTYSRFDWRIYVHWKLLSLCTSSQSQLFLQEFHHSSRLTCLQCSVTLCQLKQLHVSIQTNKQTNPHCNGKSQKEQVSSSHYTVSQSIQT